MFLSLNSVADLNTRVVVSARDRIGPGVKSARRGIHSIGQGLERLQRRALPLAGAGVFLNFGRQALPAAASASDRIQSGPPSQPGLGFAE